MNRPLNMLNYSYIIHKRIIMVKRNKRTKMFLGEIKKLKLNLVIVDTRTEEVAQSSEPWAHI